MAAIGTLAFYNAQAVEVNYYYGSLNVPMSIFALGIFAAGVVFTLILMLPGSLRAMGRSRRYRKTCEAQEKELNNLRKIPVEQSPAAE